MAVAHASLSNGHRFDSYRLQGFYSIMSSLVKMQHMIIHEIMHERINARLRSMGQNEFNTGRKIGFIE